MYSSESAKRWFLKTYGTDPDVLIKKIAQQFSGGDLELAARLYDYAARGWIKFSSSIFLSVLDSQVLPISCFLFHVEPHPQQIIHHLTAVNQILLHGGGISGNWSLVKHAETKSPGPVGFLNIINASVKVFNQAVARKGAYAAYMDITHPAIYEFITMRIPGGDSNRKNLNLHHAVNLSDKFMLAVKNNLQWDLICPETSSIVKTVKARDLWELILETRYRTGEPYLNFLDTVNNGNPQILQNQGLYVSCSNLCNEIHLPTQKNLAAVCCLSSLNAAEFQQWKMTNLVEDVIEMLDNVVQWFIEKAPQEMRAAVKGAELLRPIGLGVLGLAQLYQRENIPFDSEEAAQLNQELFAFIKARALIRTNQLALTRGEPPALLGSGLRNSHLLAVAPTANSATVLRTSSSVEPWPANAFVHRTKTGSVLIKNPELESLLEKRGKNNPDIWNQIILNEGSVQRLEFLSEREKAVFKTAYETDALQIIRQAADRQKYICQGQSLTLFLPKNMSRMQLHQLHWAAWEEGCKGLYYIRTKASHRVESLSDCTGCQG